MSDSRVFDRTMFLLEKAMDITARRHNLVSTNVANVDTVGYRPKDLDFQKTLARYLEKDKGGPLTRTNERHYPSADGVTVDLSGETRKSDASELHPDTVDIDKEMVNLSENNIQYRTAVELMLRKMGILRQAVTEGGQ